MQFHGRELKLASEKLQRVSAAKVENSSRAAFVANVLFFWGDENRFESCLSVFFVFFWDETFESFERFLEF